MIEKGSTRKQVDDYLELRGYAKLPETILRGLLKEKSSEDAIAISYWLNPQ